MDQHDTGEVPKKAALSDENMECFSILSLSLGKLALLLVI